MPTLASKRKRRPDSGLTLVELLVVLAVLGALTALAVPTANRLMPGLQARAIADRVIAEARTGRALAIGEGRAIGLHVDLDDRTIALDGRREWRIPNGLDVSFVFARQLMRSERQGEVRFFPDGTSTGGRITLATGGKGQTVRIDWFNGTVNRETYRQE